MAAHTYTNRKGNVYHLQSKPGKAGRVGYSVTAKKVTGTPVEQVPAGYEIWENPETAQVMIRLLRPSNILPEEKRLLEETIAGQDVGVPCIVDVTTDALVVYASDISDREAEQVVRLLARDLSPSMAIDRKRWMQARAKYSKMLRFTLADAENRLFTMERWCFRGSVDDWWPVACDGTLPDLARKYVKHLGRESFFELM